MSYSTPPPRKARLGLALTCGALLLLAGSCQKMSDEPQPVEANAVQGTLKSAAAKEPKEPKNQGKFMYFASSADFQRTIKLLGTAQEGESETARLEKWETSTASIPCAPITPS